VALTSSKYSPLQAVAAERVGRQAQPQQAVAVVVDRRLAKQTRSFPHGCCRTFCTYRWGMEGLAVVLVLPAPLELTRIWQFIPRPQRTLCCSTLLPETVEVRQLLAVLGVLLLQ
jgi:hypothetical protein